MHLAYSAIGTIAANVQLPTVDDDEYNNDVLLHYLSYQTVCDKYSNEIASIQKYIPGWVPKFR